MKKTDIDIQLPNYITKAIDMLNAGGFSAYLVGGCVRDSVMGKLPHDYDIATSALPEETTRIFENYPTIATGLKHGTLTVVINGKPIEITTYRTEGDYSDHRHPDNVKFTDSLSEDLSRRDFTINAMAFGAREGIIDSFGGIDDITGKIIRCVGDPQKRFDEDALRILRALRFSSTLCFDIDTQTNRAMDQLSGLLAYVSAERIREEFSKLLCGKNARKILETNSAVIFQIIPELQPMFGCTQNSKYHRYDVWHHTLAALRSTPSDLETQLAVLFHDIGKPYVKTTGSDGFDHFFGHSAKSAEITETVLNRLKFDNKTKNNVLWLVRHHDEAIPLTETRVKRLLASGGDALFIKLTRVLYADNTAKTKDIAEQRKSCADDAIKIYNNIISAGECLSLKNLKINGTDLISLGFSPGKEMGAVLQELLGLVLENKIKNEADALRDTALTMKAQAMYPKNPKDQS